jgi:hypothetical protein
VIIRGGHNIYSGRIDPAEIAGHEPALRVERGVGGRLAVEITEHQAGATTTDLADLAGCRFSSGLSWRQMRISYPSQQ